MTNSGQKMSLGGSLESLWIRCCHQRYTKELSLVWESGKGLDFCSGGGGGGGG